MLGSGTNAKFVMTHSCIPRNGKEQPLSVILLTIPIPIIQNSKLKTQNSIMRILLLMLLPISDTLFATPAVRALRRRYPGAHITALVYPTNSGILAHNPDVDELMYWPTRQTWPGL